MSPADPALLPTSPSMPGFGWAWRLQAERHLSPQECHSTSWAPWRAASTTAWRPCTATCAGEPLTAPRRAPSRWSSHSPPDVWARGQPRWPSTVAREAQGAVSEEGDAFDGAGGTSPREPRQGPRSCRAPASRGDSGGGVGAGLTAARLAASPICRSALRIRRPKLTSVRSLSHCHQVHARLGGPPCRR